ncbi:MAG: glycosyltransferase [Phycisphaerae bacterium]
MSRDTPMPTTGAARAAARFAVFVLLATTAFGAVLLGAIGRGAGRSRRRPGALRMLVAGTFYNVNWFRAHVYPLSQTRVLKTTYVVTDAPLFPVANVQYVCPSRRLRRLTGRNVARLLTLLYAAMRFAPDFVMGYHIMPNALLALLAARLCGGRAIYQMTGGPTQIIGGGYLSENTLLRRLGGPSPLLARLMYFVVDQCDLVVVRGRKATQFLRAQRVGRAVCEIPGSVDTARFRPNGRERAYDLVMVARLIELKQPYAFIDVVRQIAVRQPSVRAALVGDGPLSEPLREYARKLGVERNVAFLGRIDHVERVLAESKLFLLTSESEGLSIAMIEAMAAGLPVLAADVGDLGELLRPGENGAFVDPLDTPATAQQVHAILGDADRLRALSKAARARAEEDYSIAAVARRWDACLAGGVAPLN